MKRISPNIALAGCLAATAIFCSTLIAQEAAKVATASSAQAAQNKPAQKEYHPGDFYLESSHVYTLVGKTGLGHEHGVVGEIKSGELHLGSAKDAGEIVFDMTSFVADTDAARKYVGLEGTSSASTQQQVTDNMLGDQVLNVKKYPTATFRVISAEPYEKLSKRKLPQYLLKGEFTLQETTRPLEFLVEVEMAKGWQHVRGGFRIKQTDYGMKPFTKAFGAIGVADELTIWGDAWVAPTSGSSN
ncbi:YceI family protein [Aeoliella mucimassa]|uniref:YceI-like domain protein n=1 Tax=Aeoliella mucimassa TaxID=2527972 RepID=A0A518ALY4_9BACT|nr:YceI family protein [Aeoliella mucimassa]QDU55708.1 YceI-like domain protein [Aeoliella mucimassa]